MDAVDYLRDFNRFYTRELGFLGRSYLGSGLGIGEARVLWELGHGAGGDGARDLARRLGLDEGYLSRTLAGFERRGWVRRVPDPTDARRRAAHLTDAGAAALAPLEALSRAEIAAHLERLPRDGQTMLAEGCALIRTAFAAPVDPGEVTFRDLLPGDAGWIIARHSALYAESDGFDASFEALVAEILAGYIRNRDPARERAWIASTGAARLGSIFCVREDDETAKLRLFFLERSCRGLGIGRRMLDLCIDFAWQSGYRRLVLWTHKSHEAACALYAARGFTLTSEHPVRSFGRDLVEQSWRIEP